MSTGTHHDLLLLCTAGDSRVLQGLAKQLKSEGVQPKVQTVELLGLAAAIASALEQAPLVLLTVSAALQAPLAELLAGESAEALEAGRCLVLQLDEGEIEGLPEAVEVIAWPRQGRGRGKLQRELALVRIRELVADCAGGAAPAKPSQAKTAGRQAADFERRTKETLAKRVGYRCSREGCGRPTMGPNAADPAGSQCIGEAAHIEAAAPGGKRYNPEMSDQQRKSIANGIWLCEPCHTIVDGDEITYTVAVLQKWKRTAEDNAYQQLLGNPQRSSEPLSTLSGQPALDFSSYRQERGQGFHGRQWLFENVQQWALAPNGSRALLITADFGVGKTAFLSALIDAPRAGIPPVLAQHFCRTGFADTLSVGRFVTSLAEQLAEALPAYRALLADANDEQANERRQKLREANKEPKAAFEQAVLHPLNKIPAPSKAQLLVVDALEEALDPRGASLSQERGLTIVQLLADYASRLPPWLKVLATSRNRRDVVDCLRGGFFGLEVIDAEAQSNQDDIHAYVKDRCALPPLAQILETVGLEADELAAVITAKCGGKFLYAVNLLKEILLGNRTISTRKDLAALPQGMDDFYREAFACRFPDRNDYSPVMHLLALLCVQEEPLGFRELAAILKVSEEAISLWIEPLEDLLRLQFSLEQNSVSCTEDDWLISFDHISLEQWLTERSGGPFRRPRAGRFGVDREVAAAQIHTWALAEVAANRAHTSPYLVRHLASHLRDEERAEVIAAQLRQFPWLQARLRLAGLNALLSDFDPLSDGQASLPPELQRLGRALRQAAHVLSHQEGWNGEEQLASQLLARLADDGPLDGLRKQTAEWLRKAGGAPPRAATLLAPEALRRTLPVGSGVSALVALPDGRLACGCSDGTIHLWDPASGSCSAVFEGHQDVVTALAVLGDGRLASGCIDGAIRLWDPASGSCSAVFQGHQNSVWALAVLGDGRLASGSKDGTIRLWDPASGSCSAIFQGHQDGVYALVVLGDGRLASGSGDRTIRLWDPASGSCSAVFEGHQYGVNALAVLGDGRLASGSDDCTIRLWDLASGSCSAVFQGHQNSVWALAVLGDGRLASGSRDNTIRLWDPATGSCSAVFHGPRRVMDLVVLGDGRLASGSGHNTILLWDPASGSCSAIFEGHQGYVNALVVLGDGRLASGSRDQTIRLWDLASGSCSAVFQGHQGYVNALVVLGDGRLASGSNDHTIRLWDPASGSCSAVIEGPQGVVNALAVVGDGRLASGSGDRTIRMWDPASGSCSSILQGHQDWVMALAVLGDGRLASGSDDNTIRLWDPASGSCSTVFQGHQDYVNALVVLSDGRLASGSRDQTIRLWDPASGSCSAVFQGHQGYVNALVVLGDGRLASGSGDNTIRLWDPRRPDGSPRVLFVADAPITALAWVPTHRLLVAGDESGRLHWLEMGSQQHSGNPSHQRP